MTRKRNKRKTEKQKNRKTEKQKKHGQDAHATMDETSMLHNQSTSQPVHRSTVLVGDVSSAGFGLAVLAFLIEASLSAGFSGGGFSPGFWRRYRSQQQRAKPVYSVVAVALLCAISPGVYHDNPLSGHASACQFRQPVLS